MKTIETEDSLQQLAKLTPEEQAKFVDKFLSEEETQKNKLKKEEQSNQIL